MRILAIWLAALAWLLMQGYLGSVGVQNRYSFQFKHYIASPMSDEHAR
jgi:hypothetical protein